MQSNDGDDSWSIAHIEEQYMEAIERQQPIETQYLSERDNCIRSLFHNFQESATSIAQLYRGKYYFFISLFFLREKDKKKKHAKWNNTWRSKVVYSLRLWMLWWHFVSLQCVYRVWFWVHDEKKNTVRCVFFFSLLFFTKVLKRRKSINFHVNFKISKNGNRQWTTEQFDFLFVWISFFVHKRIHEPLAVALHSNSFILIVDKKKIRIKFEVSADILSYTYLPKYIKSVDSN